MQIKSNGLVKWVVPAFVIAGLVVGIKSCRQSETPVSQTVSHQALAELSSGELRALGIEGDTPEDTLRTLIGALRSVRVQQAALEKQNAQLLADNEKWRNGSQSMTDQINQAVAGSREETEKQQQVLKAEQQTLFSRLDQLTRQLGNKSISTNTPLVERDIPLGLGLDYTGQNTASGGDRLVWISPQDGLPVDSQVAMSGQPAAPRFPVSFLEDNALRRQKVAYDGMTKNQRAITEGDTNEAIRPVYTLPENTTLVGSQAMTALLGRVPVNDKVTDPYPFKILIGKDNLTANGIELPDVEGAIISGTATGDWTLSCVRGNVTSFTFVFADGTVRTVPKSDHRIDGSHHVQDNHGGSIGWLSDDNGIPCISGTRKSNAASYLSTLFALSGGTAAGDVLSQSQLTTQTNGYGGATSSLTGDAGKAVLGQAAAGGFKAVSEWIKARYGQTFDAVYVPPGASVAVHITQQIPIDYDTQGRKVKYPFSLEQENSDGLD
ncbi:TIGR03752 family integrating conjugative element protein [Photorhabdus noenieputensis]|uniref:TIGR03752 family integrating conjugative element protein n=1 Tax=Photorhabdus noenieputensis TaxID=1208607 RepID=UPI001BD44849|nr:TIGR03752 family integrating conjugative element protein [Photorhabdus noenieputensis]MBS9439873.1 TIGR03752 family integrating conjugative element protein [Photorhabdus noenieputensis]MCK3668852.1 TIGR03752 family integrating conjugative element protein [Photorhabdus noenieputensis]